MRHRPNAQPDVTITPLPPTSVRDRIAAFSAMNPQQPPIQIPSTPLRQVATPHSRESTATIVSISHVPPTAPTAPVPEEEEKIYGDDDFNLWLIDTYGLNVANILKDPITQDIFDTPVITSSCKEKKRGGGVTYSKEAIEQALLYKKECPSTRAPLHKEDLIPNLVVQSLMEELHRQFEVHREQASEKGKEKVASRTTPQASSATQASPSPASHGHEEHRSGRQKLGHLLRKIIPFHNRPVLGHHTHNLRQQASAPSLFQEGSSRHN